MTSARVLGRGRVLGGARSPLAPPSSSSPSPDTATLAHQQHKRSSSYLSPASDSSASLNSQVSGSTAQDTLASSRTQDLTSNVSLALPDNAAAASASSKLICPICNEQMVTLLQLNRHLDDAHQNLEEVEQDEVKNWFQAQVNKAKKFQPLAVLNQKFKGLEVFESNDIPVAPQILQVKSTSGHSTPEPHVRPLDPDEDVKRTHWQRPAYGDSCADPLCGKRLGGAVGQVNCRHCGKLFCEEHTMYQMKLSRLAQHEPVRGVWCRVCETCYKSREGYNDNKGFQRDHTEDFMSIRRKTVDKLNLETSRLEKRLTKLTQILAIPPPPTDSGAGGLLWGFGGGAKAQQRTLEQSVIDWEDDTKVPKCPFCQQEFSSYTFRRHHCRLCGRVICGDPQTQCSSLVGLNVVAEKSQSQVGLDIRMCKDCKHTLFSKADYDQDLSRKPPDQRTYENLVQFERGIRLLLPKFQKLLVALQNPDHPPTAAQIAEATKVRKRLTDSFIQYETAARRIRDFTTTSSTQTRLQKAVYQQASNFLHLNMLPLKVLPKILKHASPHGAGASIGNGKLPNGNGKPNGGALASIRYNDRLDTGSQASSSSALESLEAEEKELKEKLIVLEEQKFIVSEMLADARKRRKFEEMATLSANVDDLSNEIDALRGKVVRLEGDFEGLYRETASPPPELGRG